MNLTAVLVTGLLAGGISCAAVQGGLLVGLIARQHTGDTPADAPTQELSTVPTGADPSHPRAGRRPARPAARSWTTTLVDDLVPVSGFLAGKLAAYTLLGAVLGALGSVVQLSPTAHTWLQIGAGLLIITFGLSQLGVPGFRSIVISPPASWTRIVRNRTRSQAAFAPALLGVATVLLPCGITLSVEALALASGSPWQGAAIMAVFIVGTSPLFAVLGIAARKAVSVWQGRLAAATGIAVVIMGMYTLNGGLELARSPLAVSHLAETFGFTPPAPDASTVTTVDGRQEVVVTATVGYSPRNAEIKAGLATTLIVRSDGVAGCTSAFIINNEQYLLPANGDTRIDLGNPEPGVIDYSCGMGMYTGRITVN